MWYRPLCRVCRIHNPSTIVVVPAYTNTWNSLATKRSIKQVVSTYCPETFVSKYKVSRVDQREERGGVKGRSEEGSRGVEGENRVGGGFGSCRAGWRGLIGGRMGHSGWFHEIAHFTEESGPSRTHVIGLLCKLFVQYQSVVDSNGRLRPPSSHKVISGIFSL